jgi:hypothetical protein
MKPSSHGPAVPVSQMGCVWEMVMPFCLEAAMSGPKNHFPFLYYWTSQTWVMAYIDLGLICFGL